MRVLKLIMALILSIGLVTGSTLAVMAKEEKPEAKNTVSVEMYRGEVVSIDAAAGSFVIKNGAKELTITTDNNTKYFKLPTPANAISAVRNKLELKDKGPKEVKPNPGVGIGGQIQVVRKGGNPATFGDISVGNTVAVQVSKGTTLAKLVIISEPSANATSKPVDTFAKISGNITALDTTGKTIIIAPSSGAAVALNYNDQTVFTLRGITAVAVGQTAQAVYRVKDMMARSVNILPVPTPTPTPTTTAS